MSPSCACSGSPLLGLALVLVIGAPCGIYVVSEMKLNRTISVPTETVAVPTDTAAIQRGQHLAGAVASVHRLPWADARRQGVHRRPGAWSGHRAQPDSRRGGVGATFSDADFVRALRHGVDPAGRPLLIMPSDDYTNFSDADLGMIIAYVRSLPPVDNALPGNELRRARADVVCARPVATAARRQYRSHRPRGHPLRPAAVTRSTATTWPSTRAAPVATAPGFSGGKIPQAPPDAPHAANILPPVSAAGPKPISSAPSHRHPPRWARAEYVHAMALLRPDDRRRAARDLAFSAGTAAASNRQSLKRTAHDRRRANHGWSAASHRVR